MSKIISGSQTGSDSRMQVISRADFQPGLRMLPFVVRIDMVTDMNPPCAATLPRIRSQREEFSRRKRVTSSLEKLLMRAKGSKDHTAGLNHGVTLVLDVIRRLPCIRLLCVGSHFYSLFVVCQWQPNVPSAHLLWFSTLPKSVPSLPES